MTGLMTKQELSAIEQLIAQGNLEPALEQLVSLLQHHPQGAELLQIVRVNQADLYQLKAAVLKGTIAADDARLTTNLITDSVLQVLRRASQGKFSLSEAEPAPTRPQAWRYYLAGGIVALAGALLAWRLLGNAEKTVESCPKFSPQARYRVMVLPFKQTGEKKASQPEIDIADGLNVLISKTPGLKNIAEADVNEGYDIEKDYPNFAQAAGIAEGCNAQMLVWGKINQDEKNEYKLDIRYKLIGVGGTQTGDTTLGNLLRMKEEGRNLVQDVEAVTRLMYIVLANQAGVPVLPSLIASAAPADSVSATTAHTSMPDTSLLLGIAQNHAVRHETDKAIATYTRVLEAYPDNLEARVKRGSLLYEKGDFAAAARDLEVAAPNAQSAQSDILKLRIDARLQSSQPSKAREDLKSLREKSSKTAADGTWLDQKSRQVNDSLQALQRERDRMEQLAQVKPQDSKLRTGAAKANLGLGDTDRAIKNADKAIAQNPRDIEAVEVAVEARLQKGDTASARRVIENAERAGAAKSVEKWKGVIQQMPQPSLQRQRKQ